MIKIVIDLKTALPEAVKLAAEPGGSCFYTAPCIIGACMTPEQRQFIAEQGYDNASSAALVSEELVEFADPQQGSIAFELQIGFDGGPARYTQALNKAYLDLYGKPYEDV